ncbi:substrate-binding domain-containing protein [Pelagibius sp.]|uniref:substrate-binding domain-containing protein n=1 Tax=Pelagibius sp. TaxID=1931238 RepID=UPI00262E6509|nr:substrate-binding domain-containing protein [Pelagibius sp.]
MTKGGIRKRRPCWRVFLALLALTGSAASAMAGERQRIHVVSPAAVFPLAVAVSETFSQTTAFVTPVVERSEAARGFALFCEGVGPEHPDIATATRRMTRAEYEACRRRGITLSELKLGHQAVVLAKARRGASLALTRRQIFLALARQVPINGQLTDNPYRLWSDIDFSLPVKAIQVYGPPAISAVRSAFGEMAMVPAARAFPGLRSLSGDALSAFGQSLRADGGFTEVAAMDEAGLQMLQARPDSLGLFGFTLLQQNAALLQGIAIDGIAPSAESIAAGRYSLARPVYAYVKRENLGVIPGLRDYAKELAGETAAGPGGYLVRRGLVPLPPPERAILADAAARLSALQM